MSGFFFSFSFSFLQIAQIKIFLHICLYWSLNDFLRINGYFFITKTESHLLLLIVYKIHFEFFHHYVFTPFLTLPPMPIWIGSRQHTLKCLCIGSTQTMIFEWLTSWVFFQALHKSPLFPKASPITSTGHSYHSFPLTTNTKETVMFSLVDKQVTSTYISLGR